MSHFDRTACPLLAGCLLAGILAGPAYADDATPPQGLRVLSTGNSFHYYIPSMLKNLAQQAGIEGHVLVDYQGIGGSRVIQHWDLPDDQNKAKKALVTGKVDVMTMTPIFLPDEGIDHFVKLGLEKNPNMRFTLQESWLVFDQVGAPDNEPLYAKRKYNKKLDRNQRTVEEMRKEHAPVFKALEDHVRELNQRYGKDAVLIVPVGPAAILLREKIIGHQAPGLKSQDDLFIDPICHPSPVLQTLNAYCHFAVIYRKSPVGLPVPGELAKLNLPEADKLNRLLQELAWQAVMEHPLGGVKSAGQSGPAGT
jgi:hypothetical protein